MITTAIIIIIIIMVAKTVPPDWRLAQHLNLLPLK
jgi:hypothetical protein